MAFASWARPETTSPTRWRRFRRRRKFVPDDKINIVGAAGPMGTMHVIRDLCQGVPGVTVYAGDLNDERSGSLRKLAAPLAQKNKLTLKTYNPSKDKLAEKFNYIVLMAPVPALVAQAVKDAAPMAIINIFAGIPADKTGEIDLDAYIEKQCYFIGTSGSTLDDMKIILKKVASRQLDTNLSVAAIAGLGRGGGRYSCGGKESDARQNHRLSGGQRIEAHRAHGSRQGTCRRGTSASRWLLGQRR